MQDFSAQVLRFALFIFKGIANLLLVQLPVFKINFEMSASH